MKVIIFVLMNNTSFYSTVLSIRWRKKMGGMNFWARLHGQKLENVHSEGLPLAVSAAFIAAPALMNLGWLQSLSRSLVMHFLSLFFTNVLFYATLHQALSVHPSFLYVFVVFGLTTAAQMLLSSQIQPLPTYMRLRLLCIWPCFIMNHYQYFMISWIFNNKYI